MMHLAQVNIARMRGPMNSDIMKGLAARIDEINRLAEASRGFVWRLRGEELTTDDLLLLQPYIDCEPDRLFYNMSVWQSVDDLEKFIVKTRHVEMLRHRQQWVESFDRPAVALWWTPVGHRPTVSESVDRLWAIHRQGPSPHAFTFNQPFGSGAT
jgi:hypothetical protein